MITLLYKLFRVSLYGLSKSNFREHYSEAVKEQCLGMIAEIDEFSVADEMLIQVS